ncbi:MAG: intein-containing elongation factor EF-2, partial [Candidatus Diapherotrites archaeon]|nr:intein-containing elongation factor EF-2 [Candidatus Diapherotrites archaeon]
AYYKWAVSVPQMKKTGVKFTDVYEYLRNNKQEELAKKSPLAPAIFEMVITHLPNPIDAQKYRIKEIWKGDEESVIGQAMLACDPNKEFAMMVTDVRVDKHAGDIATGRVFAGTVKSGMEVKLLTKKLTTKLQKVGIFMGPDFVEVDKIPAGNIAALVGLKDVYAGETVASVDMVPFESFKSSAEPVMTVAIEAKNTKDLPKLIEVIRQLVKEDPNIRAEINQETGEHLLSGMGELHLEVTVYRIEKHHGIPVEVSPPIVVYRETITKESEILESKTPNKHNKFKIKVAPIPKEIFEKLVEAGIEGKIKPKDKVMIAKFQEIGFSSDEAKRIWAVHNNNVLLDMTRGIEALHEIRELIIQGFMDAMDSGPLAGEKCMGVMVMLIDATLHEDAIHRGPAQVLPAITRGIYACMLNAGTILLEPKQILTITVPQDYMGAVTKELSARRTQIMEMRTEGDSSIVVAKAPVKELIGFSTAMRSATQGRAIWTAEYAGYETLPYELQEKIVAEVRQRKGMEPKPKAYTYFLQ